MKPRGALPLLALAAWGAAQEDRMPEPWVVEGRIAGILQAHPLEAGRGEDAVYVDADEGGQIVAYVRGDKPREGAWARLAGRPLEFEAEPKKGGRRFRVKQLEASSWEPLSRRDRVEALVARLGDDALSREEKSRAADAIYAEGWDSFPVLIAHLGDGRVYEKDRDVQNYYALPPRGPRPQPILADVTVGSICVDILHRLLIPRYRSPHEKVFKPKGDLFVVRDWRAWWLGNRRKTLEAVHRELEPLMDRYYLSAGEPQVLDAPAGLAAQVGRAVVLEGKAVDQKLGAVLLTDEGPVWIEGLDSWPPGFYLGLDKGRRVRARGTLMERRDLPVFEQAPGDPPRGGIPVPSGSDQGEAAKRYTLSRASWELAE